MPQRTKRTRRDRTGHDLTRRMAGMYVRQHPGEALRRIGERKRGKKRGRKK